MFFIYHYDINMLSDCTLFISYFEQIIVDYLLENNFDELSKILENELIDEDEDIVKNNLVIRLINNEKYEKLALNIANDKIELFLKNYKYSSFKELCDNINNFDYIDGSIVRINKRKFKYRNYGNKTDKKIIKTQ